MAVHKSHRGSFDVGGEKPTAIIRTEFASSSIAFWEYTQVGETLSTAKLDERNSFLWKFITNSLPRLRIGILSLQLRLDKL